jgi:hypothetical protein
MDGRTWSAVLAVVAALALAGVGSSRAAGAEGAASGRTYCVAPVPVGDDANSGTEQEPWASLQRAADAAAAGDTVYVREGRYVLDDRVVLRNSGSEDAWITLASYPGEEAVLDFSAYEVEPPRRGVNGPPYPHDMGAVTAEGNYVRVERLTVRNAPCAGVQSREASHVTIAGCSTDDTYSSGISAFGGDHVTIEGNDVQRACHGGPHECITVSGVGDFIVRDNEVHNAEDWGRGGEGIDAKGPNRRGIITRNYVHDVGRLGIYVDGWGDLMQDVEVSHNTVHDCAAGVVISCEGGTPVDDIRVHHNLLYRNRGHGVQITNWNNDRGMRSNLQIWNNTIYGNGTRDGDEVDGGGIWLESLSIESVTIRNNLVAANVAFPIGTCGQDPLSYGIVIDHNLSYPFVDEKHDRLTYAVSGEGAVVGDPLLVDPGAGDFHLQFGSPAIDAGHPDAVYDDPDGTRGDIGALPFTQGAVGIGRAPREITVDGGLGDWGGVTPVPLPLSGGVSTSVRFCWREDGLYGAVAAVDDDVQFDRVMPWTADAFMLFLEPGAARSDGLTPRSLRYIVHPTPGEGDDGLGCMRSGEWYWQVREIYPPGEEAAGAWRETGDGYALEFRVGAEVLGSAPLGPGRRMGLHFVLLDGGRPVEEFSTPRYTATGSAWEKPCRWGIVELVE